MLYFANFLQDFIRIFGSYEGLGIRVVGCNERHEDNHREEPGWQLDLSPLSLASSSEDVHNVSCVYDKKRAKI
jgi:hypothetical protein